MSRWNHAYGLTTRQEVHLRVLVALLPTREEGPRQGRDDFLGKLIEESRQLGDALLAYWERDPEPRRPAHHRHPATMPRGPVALADAEDAEPPNGEQSHVS